MSTHTRHTRDHTFIVRTWREQSEHDGDEWRGSVEHVESKERRYFRDFADLCAFIARLRSAGERGANRT